MRWTENREKKKLRGITRPSGRRGKKNQRQNGMVKEVEANGAVSRRLLLPGTREMMGKVKKIGKKETMRRLMTMVEARMVSEPSA